MFKIFKRYKVRIYHYDSNHAYVRIIKYRTLKEAKKAAEYISRYPNVICEVL